MGCQSSKSTKSRQQLPEKIRQKLIEIFKAIDKDNSKSVTREEAKDYFKKFSKLNSNAMFDTLDYDQSGEITFDEWMGYWEMVKKSGHSNKEIEAEVEQLANGETWVTFRKLLQYQNDQEHVIQELEREKKAFNLKDEQSCQGYMGASANNKSMKNSKQQSKNTTQQNLQYKPEKKIENLKD